MVLSQNKCTVGLVLSQISMVQSQLSALLEWSTDDFCPDPDPTYRGPDPDLKKIE